MLVVFLAIALLSGATLGWLGCLRRTRAPIELWLVRVDGAQPRKIEGNISSWTSDERVRLSPDGKQVTFVHSAAASRSEISALESYLTYLQAAR